MSMPENNIIQFPNKLDIVSELVNNITRVERFLFAKLDALGIAATKVITKYPPPKIEVTRLTNTQRELTFISEQTIIKDTRELTRDLSPDQQQIFNAVLLKMQRDRVLNATERKKYTDAQLLRMAYSQLNPQKQLTDDIIQQGVALIYMPLGFGVITLTEDAARTWGVYKVRNSADEQAYKILGLYHRKTKDDPLCGRFMYINAYNKDTNDDAINTTLMHEYLHMLHEHYVKPFELPDPSDKDKPRDQYFGYISKAGKHVFDNMRDELVAYTYGDNNIPQDLNALLPIGLTYKEALTWIQEHELDSLKAFLDIDSLKKGVDVLYRVFKAMASMPDETRIKPQEISHIILTSQDFMQMAKRIALLIQERSNAV